MLVTACPPSRAAQARRAGMLVEDPDFGGDKENPKELSR